MGLISVSQSILMHGPVQWSSRFRGPWGNSVDSFSRRTLAEKGPLRVSPAPNRKGGNPAENAAVGETGSRVYRGFTAVAATAIIFQPRDSILRNERAACR